MRYKVLITPVEPSVDDHLTTAVFWPITILKLLRKLKPETWLLPVFCQENPYHSLNRDDYIVNVH